MPQFVPSYIIHYRNLSNDWVDSSKFESKDRVVGEDGQPVSDGYTGKRYRLISKKVRQFSLQERIKRGFLGVAAIILTLGIALFSKAIRNLFIKKVETLRVGQVIQNPKENKSRRYESKSEIEQRIRGLSHKSSSEGITTKTEIDVQNELKEQEKALAAQELLDFSNELYNSLQDWFPELTTLGPFSSWIQTVRMINIDLSHVIGPLETYVTPCSLSLNAMNDHIKLQLETTSTREPDSEPPVMKKEEIFSRRDAFSKKYKEMMKKITKNHKMLCSFNTDPEFYRELKLCFGENGEWIEQIIQPLDNFIESISNELKNTNTLYATFINQSKNLREDHIQKLKQITDEMSPSVEEPLNKLKGYLRFFELLKSKFGRLMELAKRVSE